MSDLTDDDDRIAQMEDTAMAALNKAWDVWVDAADAASGALVREMQAVAGDRCHACDRLLQDESPNYLTVLTDRLRGCAYTTEQRYLVREAFMMGFFRRHDYSDATIHAFDTIVADRACDRKAWREGVARV